jgi:putative ABC transport system ATP-binding protein
MSTGASVGVEAVTKVFVTAAGPVRAVAGVSLDVAAGSSLAITGPSGCGKSTLLSMIGALERPSAGRVEIEGARVSELGESARARLRRERIGFVFQSDNLQPFLTAVENVSLQLALSGRDDGYERSLELLWALGLGGAVAKLPDQLSGGERQRVAVARALVHRPSLILADEPTGSLDRANALVIVDLLRAAQTEVGATLIVITHDAAVAARLDRRVALRDGRVVADAAAGGELIAPIGTGTEHPGA